jgi:hypothetical protein
MNCKTNYKIDFGFIRTNIRLCNRNKIPVGTLNLKELTELGLQMKSVGEVIRLDAHFKKHCTKLQSLEIKRNGFRCRRKRIH